MALAPRLLGHGAVATMLHVRDRESSRRGEGNVYWPWIQSCLADDYVRAVALASGKL